MSTDFSTASGLFDLATRPPPVQYDMDHTAARSLEWLYQSRPAVMTEALHSEFGVFSNAMSSMIRSQKMAVERLLVRAGDWSSWRTEVLLDEHGRKRKPRVWLHMSLAGSFRLTWAIHLPHCKDGVPTPQEAAQLADFLSPWRSAGDFELLELREPYVPHLWPPQDEETPGASGFRWEMFYRTYKAFFAMLWDIVLPLDGVFDLRVAHWPTYDDSRKLVLVSASQKLGLIAENKRLGLDGAIEEGQARLRDLLNAMGLPSMEEFDRLEAEAKAQRVPFASLVEEYSGEASTPAQRTRLRKAREKLAEDLLVKEALHDWVVENQRLLSDVQVLGARSRLSRHACRALAAG